MKVNQPLLFALVLCFWSASVARGAIDEGAKIVTQKINDQLYVLIGGDGQGANVGVSIGDDGILLVDAMVEESNQRLMVAIREISDQPIRFVINTHSDFDHSGGNAFFAEMGATIITQENTRYGAAFRQLTFKDRLRLKFNDEELEAHHIASHSFDDSLIYLRGSNVMFLGDTFTNTWYPTFYSGSMAGQFAVIDKALALADDKTVVVPGHGFVTDRAGLIKYQEICRRWLARVKELSQLGTSLETMVKDPGLSQIRQLFNGKNEADFMTDQRFEKSIQRTLSTELIPAYPLSKRRKETYTGHYQFDDGSRVEVVLLDGDLYARELGSFMARLIPLSEEKFYFRAWMGTHFLFQMDASETIRSVTFVSGDTATRGTKVDS